MLLIMGITLQNITPQHLYFPLGLNTLQSLSDNFHMPDVRLDMLLYDNINSISLHSFTWFDHRSVQFFIQFF